MRNLMTFLSFSDPRFQGNDQNFDIPLIRSF